jgi:quinol monooxygenase YgiN
MQATVITISGDADAIHRAWRDELLPVAGARAAQYGWTHSIVARDGDELVVVNLWSDAAGLDRAFADEEIAAIQDERLAPLASAPPRVRRLEVLEHLTF